MGFRKASEMFPLVEQYQKSELKRQAFCDVHGIGVSILDYWIRRYRKSKEQGGDSNFIQIELDGVSDMTYLMEVQTRKGNLIRFRQLVPIDYLSRILEL